VERQRSDARRIDLKSRLEFEASAGAYVDVAKAEPIEIVLPVSTDAPAVAPVAAGKASRTQGLQERFTFETFVPGPANEFAHAVARRVASWADGHFNPVLFHGPYGFGKTHLLNALAWEAMRQAPDKRVVYLTAERFLSTFVRAVMDRQTAAFKEELRAADLLIIDDVHFIAGKQSTQEELFHTLTALVEEGRRVVFSSDRPPSAMTEMDAHLRSHLSAGLVCGLEPADRSLRMGILERKIQTLSSRTASSRPCVRTCCSSWPTASPTASASWKAR
jgi:chromosomal replication initiator protein